MIGLAHRRTRARTWHSEHVEDLLSNWSGTVTYTPAAVARPSSVPELQELVAGSRRLRARGSGHSFNLLTGTTGTLVSLAGLAGAPELDAAGVRVRVPAGTAYGALARYLEEHGRALPAMASLPHVDVVGACATGTHGSGDGVGTLSGEVTGVELVTGTGELLSLTEEDPELAGAAVHLGALGVVTAVTLRVGPTYRVRQLVYEGLALEDLAGDLDGVLGAAYSVSVFTTWASGQGQVWIKARDGQWVGEPPGRWRGAVLADGPRHPVPGQPAEACTVQGGLAGAWHERLPHFRLEHTPSSGHEIQSEVFVPRDRAAEAIGLLQGVGPRIAPALQVSEVRTVAADSPWLSPAAGQDVVAFHFTWHPDAPAVERALAVLELALQPLGARPHWGKVTTMAPELVRSRWPRAGDFAALAERLDPQGRLRNDLLEAWFPRG